MASVRVNGKTFRVRVCVAREAGKQIWRTATFQRPEGLTPAKEAREIKRLADEWERQQRDEYARGLEPDRDKMTLAAFVRGHWWPNSVETAGFAPNTLTSYTQMTRGVLEYFGEKIRLVEIDAERIGRFLRYLKVDRGLSDRTAQMHFTTLRGILSYAVSCGYLEASPIDSMRRQDKPTVKHVEPDFLTAEEIRAFLEALEEDAMPELWKAYFQLLIFGGVRRAEGLALQWKDYDVTRKELSISKSLTLTGNAEVTVKGTKTGKKRRVPVCDTLAAALEARKEETLRQYGECDLDWYIFGKTEDPAKPVNPNNAYFRLTRFQKRHGLRKTSVHLLRHSFASLALEGGANLKQVQAALGHSNASTTLLFYAGVEESQNRAAVESVERLVKK